MDETFAASDRDVKHMACMEVWGGNRCVDSGVIMAGLDAWLYSQPCGGDSDGGDVHYVSSCAAGMITRLLVADVCGHGQPAAHAAQRLRTLMRRYINHHDQTRFVRSMNSEFKALSPEGGFATAVVMTFEATKNQLLLSNAGHPPPLVYHCATGEWEYLEHGRSAAPELANIPLGIEEISDYGQLNTRLRVGDLVVCYTDSLPESYDASGEMLGQSGLLRIIRTLDASNPAQLVPSLLQAIADGGSLAGDDVTVLVFRPNGLRPRIPLSDLLLAPLRVARAVVGSYLT